MRNKIETRKERTDCGEGNPLAAVERRGTPDVAMPVVGMMAQRSFHPWHRDKVSRY